MREFGVVAVFSVFCLFALQHSVQVHATAEYCHTVWDSGFSCMDCTSCQNCLINGSCDTHCSTCGPCFEDPNSTDCDQTTCDIEKCQGCALCVNCDPGCRTNCSPCQYYMHMLDCQNGPCSACEPCYDNMDAPGCEGCASCLDCQNCNIQPDCHDCRCCKEVGCAVCAGEDVECPAEGYTAEELSHTFIPPPPAAPHSSDGHADNGAEIAFVVIAFAVVVLLIVNFGNFGKASEAGSAEDKKSLLSKDPDGTSLPNYQSTDDSANAARVPSSTTQSGSSNL